MRKTLDTRLINNLNKRKPIQNVNRYDHIISENDIDRVVLKHENVDGRKSYAIYVKKLYTGENDFGPYLEEHFGAENLSSITIIASTLPDFYFSISAFNEIGDNLFSDYDIDHSFQYITPRELPADTLLSGTDLNWTNWYVDAPEGHFKNFNGVWIIGDVIWEAE